MKKQLLIIFIGLFISLVAKSQITYTINYNPPTCSTCCDGSASLVNVTGGCPPYLYLWQGGGTGYTSYGTLCYGDSLTFTISDMCGQSSSGTARMMAPTGISDLSKNSNAISVYPNPATDMFRIETSGEKINFVEVYNSLGEKIKELNHIEQNQIEIDLTNSYPGVYYIKCKSKTETGTIKLIKQ